MLCSKRSGVKEVKKKQLVILLILQLQKRVAMLQSCITAAKMHYNNILLNHVLSNSA